MMVKQRLLSKKFKNSKYFLDLSSYIEKVVHSEELSYDDLNYLYNNMYKNKSDFIKQNIYPVCEFLKKGYSIDECEELATILTDANELTIFSNSKEEVGYKYNKLFYDLLFVYNTYDKYIKMSNNKSSSFLKTKFEIEITDVRQRSIEMRIIEQDYLESELNEEIEYLNGKLTQINNKINLSKEVDGLLITIYNRLQKTKSKVINYMREKQNQAKNYQER